MIEFYYPITHKKRFIEKYMLYILIDLHKKMGISFSTPTINPLPLH
jgi:hypothetical protein